MEALECLATGAFGYPIFLSTDQHHLIILIIGTMNIYLIQYTQKVKKIANTVYKTNRKY